MSLWDIWSGVGSTIDPITIDGQPLDWWSTDLPDLPPVFDTTGAGGFVFEPGSPFDFRDALDPGRFTLGASPTLNDLQAILEGAGLQPGPAVADILRSPLWNDVFVDSQGRLVGSNGAPLDESRPGLRDQINGFLRSEVGRLVATAALGGAGLLTSRLATGSAPALRLPGLPPPTPATSAARSALEGVITGGAGAPGLADVFRTGLQGQAATSALLSQQAGRELASDAEAAPLERTVRLNALTGLPELLQPSAAARGAAPTTAGVSRLAQAYLPGQGQVINTTATPATGQPTATVTPVNGAAQSLTQGSPIAPLNDPIRAGLAAELERAFRGELPNPALDQQFRQEQAQLETELSRSLGPNWALSTAGGQRLRQLLDSQDARRQQYRMATIATLAPMEQSRQQFAYNYPLNVLNFAVPEERARVGQAEGTRQTDLSQRAGLTQMGRQSPLSLSTGLGGYVPIQPLLGLDSAEADRRTSGALANQAALEEYRAQQQSRSDLARGVGGLFGTVAGTLTPAQRLTLAQGVI